MSHPDENGPVSDPVDTVAATGQYQTFVVRYWTGDPSALRGHIQHVATGRGLYFRDVERMLRFIDEHVKEPPRLEPERRPQEAVMMGMKPVEDNMDTAARVLALDGLHHARCEIG